MKKSLQNIVSRLTFKKKQNLSSWSLNGTNRNRKWNNSGKTRRRKKKRRLPQHTLNWSSRRKRQRRRSRMYNRKRKKLNKSSELALKKSLRNKIHSLRRVAHQRILHLFHLLWNPRKQLQLSKLKRRKLFLLRRWSVNHPLKQLQVSLPNLLSRNPQ